MTYRVHVTRRAEQDRDQAFAWYYENYSRDFAAQWYAGISRAIRDLKQNPLGCPNAHESYRFPFEIRELLHGKSKKNRHRILFRIQESTIYIVHIRHSARADFERDDVS